MKTTGYNSSTQTEKNIAWMLPRPKPDHYKGGMPLYCEDWLVSLAGDLLGYKSRTEFSILNVFCGMNKHGCRVDLNKEVKPDFVSDIHTLSDVIPAKNQFDVILADPPYSDEETDKLYGKHLPRLKYSVWTKECDKFLRDGGLFIIYHKFLVPNPNPEKYEIIKRVAVFNRIWHLPRVAIVFRKKSVGTLK